MCRLCGAPLNHTFIDLGSTPLANRYLTAQECGQPEIYYPLHAYVCEYCFLVQLKEQVTPEAQFSQYSYFTGYSETALDHAKRFALQAFAKLYLSEKSRVIEVASNDGYLLQYFRDLAIPVLGIEPARNIADVALDAGIPTRCEFFTAESAQAMAERGVQADLLIANNVLAHVNDLHGFVHGLRLALKPEGTLVVEFPHLLNLIVDTQFDQIYHEHLSYFSLGCVHRLFKQHHLYIDEVEHLYTHGGSLRIWATHSPRVVSRNTTVFDGFTEEDRVGLRDLARIKGFAKRVEVTKHNLIAFLNKAREQDKTVVGYGAPAKATTLLNACGIGRDLISYIVDKSPHKVGRFMPGNHIPIHAVEQINETKPDYLLILPWNIREEVMTQMQHVTEWGCQFVDVH